MKPPHTILLVEDNPADVIIARRALKVSELSVDLVVVQDGQEAIDYLLRQGPYADGARPPDLILLDINLPRMTGREVLERIRATASPVPVVVLTTSARREDVAQMYRAGANVYIPKPQEFGKFVEVLRTIHHHWLETALLPPRDE